MTDFTLNFAGLTIPLVTLGPDASTALAAAARAEAAEAAVSGAGATALQKASNLADLDSAVTARGNLGLAAVAASGSAADLITGTLPSARMPAFTGDVTSAAGSLALAISPGAVSNAKLANVATATFKGRATAGAGSPEDLTGTQATALLDAFTSAAKGLAPASGGGTTNFLRADGVWAAPPSGGGGGTTTNVLTINSGGAGVASGGTFNGSTPVTISYNSIGAAPLASPTFTGVPAAATAAAGTNTTQLATTAFVATALVGRLLNKGNYDCAAAPNFPAGTSGDIWFVSNGGKIGGGAGKLVDLGDVFYCKGNTAAGDLATVGGNWVVLKGSGVARPIIGTPSAGFTAADADNNTHKVASGSGQTLTLGSISAGTSFTVRFKTGWSLAVTGGLSKNGASPTGVTTGSVAANSLITFLHEGSGVWVASGAGLT